MGDEQTAMPSTKSFRRCSHRPESGRKKHELRAFWLNLRIQKNQGQLRAAPGEDKGGEEGAAIGEISMNAT